MSRTRSDLSINIGACHPIGFSYGQACKRLEKNGCINVETERSEKLFGKRNAETDQEPSSSSCSESDQSKSSKKTSPQKDRKFLSSWLGRYKWWRCENDLMFCDTCLTAKACSNPFTEGCTTSQNSTLI